MPAQGAAPVIKDASDMCDYRLAYQEKAQPKRLTNLSLTVRSYAPNFVEYEAVNEGVNKGFIERVWQSVYRGFGKCLPGGVVERVTASPDTLTDTN